MKAVVCDRYGPPEILRITEVPRPVPGPDEILIKIRATTVNRSDCAFRAGTPRPYARLFTGVPVHDVTSGFVGYRAEALRRIDLDGIQSNGYAFLMEMKFKLYRAGARFAEFPITFSERRSGRSKFNRAIAVEGAKFPLRAWRARIGA
jgi:hypothetical protein